MNQVWYWVLWVFEVVAIVIVALLLMLPIQDYARREYQEWRRCLASRRQAHLVM
jgi:hypothetical protein